MRQDATHSHGFDPRRRFVRVRRRRDNGLVEFEFAIGEPEMFVELILPEPAFQEFCAANAVSLLEGDDDPPVSEEERESRWTLREATAQRFRGDAACTSTCAPSP
ncbi:MAG: phenol hydroxylase subunit [Steroidobacteraceae bacterium]